MRPLLRATLAVMLATTTNGAEPSPATLRVLFVGNSLTHTNDLPATVERVAAAAGRPILAGAVTAPGVALEDHWRDGAALEAIRTGSWDVVVLQQGPSSLPENRRNLRNWARRFAKPIRAAGARPALLMVWPSEARSFAFDDVHAAYASAARAVDGVLLPAGQAWRAAWSERPELALYGADRFHPSRLGTLLAALSVVDGLTGALPEDASEIAPELDEATWTLLLDSVRASRP